MQLLIKNFQLHHSTQSQVYSAYSCKSVMFASSTKWNQKWRLPLQWNMTMFHLHNMLVIVQEQVPVLFRAGTTSLRSRLGTFFVPESNSVDHTACKVDNRTLYWKQLIDIIVLMSYVTSSNGKCTLWHFNFYKLLKSNLVYTDILCLDWYYFSGWNKLVQLRIRARNIFARTVRTLQYAIKHLLPFAAIGKK